MIPPLVLDIQPHHKVYTHIMYSTAVCIDIYMYYIVHVNER